MRFVLPACGITGRTGSSEMAKRQAKRPLSDLPEFGELFNRAEVVNAIRPAAFT
jgi:hypothetical protein